MNPASNIQSAKQAELKQYFPDLYGGKASTSHISPRVDLEKEIRENPEKKKLFDTAVEFQSIFVNMMLKSMRSNLNKDNDMLHAGMKQDIFEDMLYDEYSKEMSKDPRFDLAKQIYVQFSGSVAPDAKKALEEYKSNMKTPTPGISGERLIDSRF